MPHRSRHLRASRRPIALLALASVALAGTGTASAGAAGVPKPPSSNVTVSEAGSTLLEPLFVMWSSAYEHKYPNVNITPSGGGSGTGISDAETGTVDIGASDAYLASSALQQYPGLKNIALAISAQMVNYNVKGVPASTHLKLSGKVLSEIYRGKVTNWDDAAIQQLNPGVKLPSQKIVALHRTDSSGDTFLFSSYLSDADASGWGKSIGAGTSIGFPSISGALGEEGNGGMVTGCKATPGCIAYIGISYRSDTQAGHLGEAQLQNRSGNFTLPDAATISAEAAAFTAKTPANESISLIYGPSKKGYPIVNYEYAIVPAQESSKTEASAVRALLSWAISPADGNSAHFLGKVDFQPLPSNVERLSSALIAKVSG